MSPSRQTVIGLALSGLIAAAWIAVHVYGVFFHDLGTGGLSAPVALVLLQTWLGTGLFIIAHDAMHGSLAPGRPGVNRWVGKVALGLYAGFDYEKLYPAHHAHHRAPGTPEDPDFHAEAPTRFWPWFVRFFTTYFGWKEFAILTVALLAHVAAGARVENLLLFWAAPALTSAAQLFFFGTYLPHRHGTTFADRHNARSVRQPIWTSLFTCYHFGGFHHEHHLRPDLPWWRLPEARS